jgi:type IX secretion system PorP/SprF family membrane protein
MFKRFLIVGVFLIVEVAVAQQEGMFSQYMYNPSALNTAYTGTRDETILYFQYRSQWNSFEGAPRSSYFNYQKQGAKKLSTGISIMQESSGPMNQLTAGIDLAYKIQLSGDSFMSFGIKPMIDYLDVNFNSLNIYNPQDPWFDINIDQKLSPNLGLGVFYYDDRGYIGLSTSGILSTKHFDQSSPTSYLAADRAHYYLMAGKVLELNDNILFKPSFLMRMVKGVPIQADISANLRIQDRIEAGLSYRFSGAMSALMAVRVQRNVLIGYSYDKELGYIGNFTGSTSELFIRYELLPKVVKTIFKPRFF